MSEAQDYIIELEDVHKGFPGIQVLRGITIRVHRGETLVVIGQSGTGKSVSLRLMIGLLHPDQGQARFEGQDIAGFRETDLVAMRRRMSMLFQGGALFDSLTVGENVGFALRTHSGKSEDEIQEIIDLRLRQVGLPGTQEKMPSELSGGMRKRAALARSIAEEPEVILYDEPTTGLDPIMSDAIADLILDTRENLRNKNVTSIVVTHDMHVATKAADRVIMLHQGRIVGEGPPEHFDAMRARENPEGLNDEERMIRQFVRGEASGPIEAVK